VTQTTRQRVADDRHEDGGHRGEGEESRHQRADDVGDPAGPLPS
jgi:hypothetical protein